jgi:predicted RNase H-like HicB family nuclease
MGVLLFGVARGSDYIARAIGPRLNEMTGKLSYTIQLRPEPEGGFTVLVPALPEIITYGVDEVDALHMAHEAIELAIEVRRQDGEEIPADVVPLTRTIDVAA